MGFEPYIGRRWAMAGSQLRNTQCWKLTLLWTTAFTTIQEESAVSNSRYFEDNPNTTLQQSYHCLPSNWLETKKSLTMQFEWLHGKWIVRSLATFSNDLQPGYTRLWFCFKNIILCGQQVEDNQCDNKMEKTCNEKLEEQSKRIGEVVQLSSKWTILKNDWRRVRILQMGKRKSANLFTRLSANYEHLMRKWMHKLESSNNLIISQPFASISNYCTYLNLYKQVSQQNFFNYEG